MIFKVCKYISVINDNNIDQWPFLFAVYRWRCSNPTVKCSKGNWLQECNKNVKLSFCGGRYSEEPWSYGECETDSEKEDNKYNRFECYSDVAEDELKEDEHEEEGEDEFRYRTGCYSDVVEDELKEDEHEEEDKDEFRYRTECYSDVEAQNSTLKEDEHEKEESRCCSEVCGLWKKIF